MIGLLGLAAVLGALGEAGAAAGRLGEQGVAALADDDRLGVAVHGLHLVAALALDVPEERVGALDKAPALVLGGLDLLGRVREVGVKEDHFFFWKLETN